VHNAIMDSAMSMLSTCVLLSHYLKDLAQHPNG
jgi:hypothetical protein